METLDSIALELNKLLDNDKLDKTQIDCYLTKLKVFFNVKIEMLDFVYFNEERQSKAQKKKTEAIDLSEFELAAHERQLELNCKICTDLKNAYNIQKSRFYSDQGHLYYIYLGTNKNDSFLKEYLLNI